MLPSETSPLLQSSSTARNHASDGSSFNQERSQTEIKGTSTSNNKETLAFNTIDDTNITNQTVVALAVTVFVQSYLLEGVFPYAGFLTIHLLKHDETSSAFDDVSEETVGKYAGYIACSFMAGRTVTAVYWGKLADAYGRVFVLKVSLLASAITSLGFGFASTYWEALTWRFLMGVGNGITGTVKCLLSEIKESSRSESRETKTMAIVYGMRGYGFLLCPAITGYLSDPLKQYPRATTIPSWIQSLLLAYPFVLPNLLACFLCCGAYRLVRDHVEETLPTDKRQPFCSLVPIRFRSSSGKNGGKTNTSNEVSSRMKLPVKQCFLPIEMDNEIETSDNNTDTKDIESAASVLSKTTGNLLWSSRIHRESQEEHIQDRQRDRIRGQWFHLYVYWVYSFLNIASDELFPLFCLSKLSGLGFQENQISFVLGGTTVVYGMLQYTFLTGFVQKLGLYPTLRIGIFGSIPPAILIPIGSLWLIPMMGSSSSVRNDNDDTNDDDDDDSCDNDGFQQIMKPSLLETLYLCILIAVIKSFSSVVFSTITMATNRTVDTIEQRATLNGIASFGGSFAKACGPVFAGILFSFLASNRYDEIPVGDAIFLQTIIKPPYGSVVTYGILSILGLFLGVQTFALHAITSSE